MDRVKLLPLALLDVGESVTTRAAKLKAGHGLPYADCFAAAIVEPGKVIVTADARKAFGKSKGFRFSPSHLTKHNLMDCRFHQCTWNKRSKRKKMAAPTNTRRAIFIAGSLLTSGTKSEAAT